MPNRLAEETSPYLLQHKDNPVDWYPWGDEAFAKAREEDKPILLSVGYAACHWCHVMERESFEDAETAKLMNDWFVPVKVDREERPDVDAVYMGAVQALTGHGGWPMTVFMAPDGTPFLGGTYFPPEDRQGMPAFKRVLAQVHELWAERRGDLMNQGKQLVEMMSRTVPASTEPITAELVTDGARKLAEGHDQQHGGFGTAPKFPQTPSLDLLMRTADRVPDLQGMLSHTLGAMAFGGIYDQLGGGFHRYTVDAGWLVPHFEKMLYDNAQLARVYVHAWQRFGHDELYRRIATETLDYLLRDMRDPGGGFHSSEDADSEGVEGRFYVWSYEEFMAVAPDAARYYGVSPEGNWEGTNILTADGLRPPAEDREKLLAAREQRVRPGKDDKVLASWNGLAIAALAEAGAAFGEERFLEAAREAAGFVLDTMRDADGGLLHSYRDGRAKISGLLEDHAYLCDGLLALWEATFEPRWLEGALGLAEASVGRFAADGGGFHASDHDDLIVRQKEIVESATPAPGGVLALALMRLAVLFDRDDLRRHAVDALRAVHAYMEQAPQAVPTWISAADFYLSTPQEVALVGDLSSDAGRALVETVTSRYLPNRVLAGGSAPDVALLRDKTASDGPTAYVCERYVCQRPTSDPEELEAQLTR